MLTEVTPSSVKHVRKPEHQELAILLGVGEAHDFSDPTRLSRLVTIRASQAHERIPLFPEPKSALAASSACGGEWPRATPIAKCGLLSKGR